MRGFRATRTAAAAAPPAIVAPGADPALRAFDFWIGEWDVHTPDGRLAGRNRIELKHGGRVLHEQYASESGYSGESLNIFDATRTVWHQTWVDSSGLLLLLEGGLRYGKMVLEGRTVDADARPTEHRITWTPNPNGSVRQLWESTDTEGRWGLAFDGIYTREQASAKRKRRGRRTPFASEHGKEGAA